MTLKLVGFEVTTSDAALSAIRMYGRAFFFDLDIRYGVTLQFRRERAAVTRRRREPPSELSPAFPHNAYAPEPLELYEYGRSAQGFPLLQFLAFYQCLEYFFPFFAREETVRTLRTELLDPRFNPASDTWINRLINTAAPAARGIAGGRELDQLRFTIRATIQAEDLREYFEHDEQTKSHFCGGKRSIAGANQLRLEDKQADLRDQVADRVYAIRNRVVHTKEDGGAREVELLLPSSAEAESLALDTDLLRLLASKALIARAQRGA
jgi:hypothetical protein